MLGVLAVHPEGGPGAAGDGRVVQIQHEKAVAELLIGPPNAS